MPNTNEHTAAEGAHIVAYPDGPFLVRGSFTISDEAGHCVDINRDVMALCRCGRSRAQPLCDGSHTRRRISSE